MPRSVTRISDLVPGHRSESLGWSVGRDRHAQEQQNALCRVDGVIDSSPDVSVFERSVREAYPMPLVGSRFTGDSDGSKGSAVSSPSNAPLLRAVRCSVLVLCHAAEDGYCEAIAAVSTFSRI